MKPIIKPFLFVFLFGLFVFLAWVQLSNAFPKIPLPYKTSSESVYIDANLSHPYVLKGTDAEVLMNINIKGKEVISTNRASLNIALVIDRSGSMAEKGKLEYAKKAAIKVINSLNSNDRLAIVAYSTNVETLFPLQEVNNKRAAINAINSLYPTNSTNLSGGLNSGIDILKSYVEGNYINRVILLSDGLANVGITDIKHLSRIAGESVESGVHITTMGLGLNYDENLLTNIAEHGAGNYYFIESPTQLAGIFEKEFSELSLTVAKDPVLNISLPSNIKLEEIYGYTYTRYGNVVKIKMGDIFSGQERNILVRLRVPASKLGEQKLADIYLEFIEIGNEQSAKLAKQLNYIVSNDSNLVSENENNEVSTREVSLKAAKSLYDAATYYEKGEHKHALSTLNSALGKIRGINNSPYRTKDTIGQELVFNKAIEEISASPTTPESDDGKKIIKQYKSDSRQQQK
ncbi:MAG: VWA domain-containing protein [Thermodesulfobacteriota bacterium]